MRSEPSIFSVLVFKPAKKNYISCDIHFVAALSSVQAEECISRSHSCYLSNSRCFIETDENLDCHHNPAVRMYVDSFNSELLTNKEFNEWVRNSTNKSLEDGEILLPNFKEFYPISDY